MDTDCQNHIENCRQCQADVGWLQWLYDFGVREKQYEPPAWAMTNAQNIFLKKLGLVTIAKEIVANLIYDSFNERLPVGVRYRDLSSRHALYKAGNIQLDLKIEWGDEKGLIVGQIVADAGDMELSGLQIQITQQGEAVGKSRTNRLGEFIFQNLPKGNYELQVILSETVIKLPSLPLRD
jgi:hypothetical protein